MSKICQFSLSQSFIKQILYLLRECYYYFTAPVRMSRLERRRPISSKGVFCWGMHEFTQFFCPSPPRPRRRLQLFYTAHNPVQSTTTQIFRCRRLAYLPRWHHSIWPRPMDQQSHRKYKLVFDAIDDVDGGIDSLEGEKSQTKRYFSGGKLPANKQ